MLGTDTLEMSAMVRRFNRLPFALRFAVAVLLVFTVIVIQHLLNPVPS